MHRWCRCINEPGALKLAKDCRDATRTVNVFDVVLLGRRCNLANVRQPTTERVDIRHREIDFAFVGGSEDVQHSVGASTHCDVERHGVLECCLVRNNPGKNRLVVLLVVAHCEINDCATRLQEQSFAISMGCQHCAVTRK